MLQKKLILTILMWIIGFISSFADNYTREQILFRNDINGFLKEEGYFPSIDNQTGNIHFKVEGTNFVVSLDNEYNGPYLVILSAAFEMGTLYSTDKARLYQLENTLNSKYHCVKLSYVEYEGSNILIFSVESFCHSSESFKYALIKYLGIIKVASLEFKSLYNGESSLNNEANSDIWDNTSSKPGNRIFVNGAILKNSYYKWWVTSIELNTHNTVVNKIVVPKEAETYVMATRNEYIEDCATRKRYYIISSSIGIEPQKTILHSKKANSFSDVFPALPASVKRINIWSGSNCCVKNLIIR